MARSTTRKLSLYRLNISGLTEDETYHSVILAALERTTLADRIHKDGQRSHALHSANQARLRLRMTYMSYREGERPDILDTTNFDIMPNPLGANQTGVHWTHALGGEVNGKYYVALEEYINGIRFTQIERYLQWLLDERYVRPKDAIDPLTVSVEAVPSAKFMQRVDSLERVTQATVRIARPNFGWMDLEDDLGEAAEQSDAKGVELTMKARRGASLRRDRGLLSYVRELIGTGGAVFARVEGTRDGEADKFSTENLKVSSSVDMPMDDHGQLRDDAWPAFYEYLDREER